MYISEDKDLFQSLLQNKKAIEDAAEMKFDWRELPERKARRIVVEKAVDLADHSQWTSQFEWVIEMMLKMKKAFKPYL